MWTYNYINELYHYGIQGMKWGHRKRLYETQNDYDYRMKRKEAKKQYRQTKDKTQYKKDKLKAKVDYYKKEEASKKENTGKYLSEKVGRHAASNAAFGAVTSAGKSVVKTVMAGKLGGCSVKDIAIESAKNAGKSAILGGISGAVSGVALDTIYFGLRNNNKKAEKAQKKLDKLNSRN